MKKQNLKPTVIKKTFYCFGGKYYEEIPSEECFELGYKLYNGEKLLKNSKFENELYYALLDKNGNVVMQTSDYYILRNFFDGRISFREKLLDEVEYSYKHVSTHPEFNPNDPKDKAIVDLYNALKDPEDTLCQFEHCVYSGVDVDVNILKWLGNAIACLLYTEKEE